MHITSSTTQLRAVMLKIGMRREGTLRQHTKKWDQFEDVEVYGLLSCTETQPTIVLSTLHETVPEVTAARGS